MVSYMAMVDFSSNFFGTKHKQVPPHPRAIKKFKQGYNDWMCDQDAKLFPGFSNQKVQARIQRLDV